MSIVYMWAPDEVTQGTAFVDALRSQNTSMIRYPGGDASYWNWENPSGKMGKSTLNPKWDGKVEPAANWMSLEEYLDLCKATGARPLVGVNYNCDGNPDWVSQSESVAAAVRQVEFVVSHGFRGAWYYVGNEDNVGHYWDRWRAHVTAMKRVDPTMRVFFNNNKLNPKLLTRALQEVGDIADGAEFHGKWPFGGEPDMPAYSFHQWLDEVPLVEHRSKLTWRQRVLQVRQAAHSAGRPDLLLANIEYGLGKPMYMTGFNKFTKSLVCVEFAMEMYISGYDLAVFWDTFDGGTLNDQDRMMTASLSGHRWNPMRLGMDMLRPAAGGSMYNLSTSTGQVHGFAAMDATDDVLRIFVLNKLEAPRRASISVGGASSLEFAEAMVDTEDHWGRRVRLDPHLLDGTTVVVMLPALSFSVIVLSTSSLNTEVVV
eukprot:CAMPEP_0170575298 /NCGR_PEP_ID=MMETSP0224-20130122/3790_1 /TAXON_ID=285029 /ORGANISM="Togula jolla, Strain CCCM 725" /LENGTH=427 /DNA_ID=CAMNT_0010898075 /DNA_START=153 /DNA_END=1436 /DNA_ORIENTATION=+